MCSQASSDIKECKRKVKAVERVARRTQSTGWCSWRVSLRLGLGGEAGLPLCLS